MKGTVVEIGPCASTPAGRGHALALGSSGYYARIQDEILSIDDDPERAAAEQSVDQRRRDDSRRYRGARRRSFALGGNRHRLEPLLSLTLNEFSFDSDPRLWQTTSCRPRRPMRARGEVIYRHASGFYAGPTFDFIGKRYADFANTLHDVDSYKLLGLRAESPARALGGVRRAAQRHG